MSPKKPMRATGSKLREVRARRGMSQRDLADAVDVHQGSVSRWERSGRIPEQHVEPVADALNVDVDELLGGAETSATPDRTRIVASADAEERWVEAVRNSDLDREMKMLLVYLTGQSVLNRQHWIASVDPQSLADTVNEDPEWVREKWDTMLETEFVEQLGPGPCTLRLVIPE